MELAGLISLLFYHKIICNVSACTLIASCGLFGRIF